MHTRGVPRSVRRSKRQIPILWSRRRAGVHRLPAKDHPKGSSIYQPERCAFTSSPSLSREPLSSCWSGVAISVCSPALPNLCVFERERARVSGRERARVSGRERESVSGRERACEPSTTPCEREQRGAACNERASGLLDVYPILIRVPSALRVALPLAVLRWRQEGAISTEDHLSPLVP
jgi:hypothetical protein